MRTLTLCLSLVVFGLPYTRSSNEKKTVPAESDQEFKVMPSDTEVNPGENVNLQCKVLNRRGDCVWLKDNLIIGRIPGKYNFEVEPEDGDCTLQIVNATLEKDDASWKCQVTKATRKGSPITSSAIKLIVLEQPGLPYLKEGTGSLHHGDIFKTMAGDTRSVQCVSRKGNPPASLRWFLDSNDISDLANQTNYMDEKKPRTWKALSVLNYNFTEADNRKKLKCVAYHSAYEKTAQEPEAEGLGHREVAVTLDVMSVRDEHTTASTDTSSGTQTSASAEDGNVINSKPSTKDQAGTPTITTGEAGEQKQTTESTEAGDHMKTTASTKGEEDKPIPTTRELGEDTQTTLSAEAGDVIKNTASTMAEPGALTATSGGGGENTQTTPSTEAGDVIKTTASKMAEPGAPTTTSTDGVENTQTTLSTEAGDVIKPTASTIVEPGAPTTTSADGGKNTQTTPSTEAGEVIKPTPSTMFEPGTPNTTIRGGGENTHTTPSTETGEVIKTTASTMAEPGAPTTTSRGGGENTQTTPSTEAGEVIKTTASTMAEPGAPTTTSRDGGENTETTPSTEAVDVIKTTASTMVEPGAPTTTSRDGGEYTQTTPSTEAGDVIKITASTMVEQSAPTTTSRDGGENSQTTSSAEGGDVIKTTAPAMVEQGAPTTTGTYGGKYTQTTPPTEVGDVNTRESTKDGASALDTTSAGTTHDDGTTAPTTGSISESASNDGVSSTPTTRSDPEEATTVSKTDSASSATTPENTSTSSSETPTSTESSPIPDRKTCNDIEEKNCKKTPFGRCDVKNGKGVCSCEPPLRLVNGNCNLDQTVVKVTFKLKKKSRVTFSNDDDCPPEEVIKEEVENIFQDKTIISAVNITCWEGEVTMNLVFEKSVDSEIADTVKDTLEKRLFNLGEYVLQKDEIKTTLVNHCEMGLSTLGKKLGGLKCIQRNNAYALVCDTTRAIRVGIMDVSGFEVELCQDKPCTEYCSEHENKECEHEKCLCKRGFQLVNDSCVSVCTQNLCKNGGTCKPDAVVDFTCTCPPKFKGQLCEEENKEVLSATLNTVVIGVVLSALLLICLVLTGSIILRLKKKNQILAKNCEMWSNGGK